MKGKQIIEGFIDHEEATIESKIYKNKGFKTEVKLGNLVECHGICTETWELHIT